MIDGEVVITVGLLHTSALHVPTFDRLLAATGVRADSSAGVSAPVSAAASRVVVRHVVDESLLADPGPDLTSRVAARLVAAGHGADAVLCTCSTIGAVAESLADMVGRPVVRIDRPMARAAVRLARDVQLDGADGGAAGGSAGSRGSRGSGGVIGVVAAVPSTLAPTESLLREVAASSGASVGLRMLPCPEAWPLFLRGDQDAYLDEIAALLRRSDDGTVSVFVLAQASMAAAAERCADLSVPVLSSPALAAAELLRVAGSSTSDRSVAEQ